MYFYVLFIHLLLLFIHVVLLLLLFIYSIIHIIAQLTHLSFSHNSLDSLDLPVTFMHLLTERSSMHDELSDASSTLRRRSQNGLISV